MTNKHPDALGDGTFSKSTTKRLDLCTSGEPVKESAESMQMDALVEVAIDAMYGVTIDEAIDKQVNGMRAVLLAIGMPKLLADSAELAALRAAIAAAPWVRIGVDKVDIGSSVSLEVGKWGRLLIDETNTPESSVSGDDLAGNEREVGGG